MSVQRERADLAKGYRLLKRKGHAVGNYIAEPDSEMCILGALAVAIGGCIVYIDGEIPVMNDTVPKRFVDAARRFWCFMPTKWHDTGRSMLEDILEFSDADESAVRDRVFRLAMSDAEPPEHEHDWRDLELVGDTLAVKTPEATA
ncbi:MAG: hypothetical protein OXU74_06640 [Gemmatimonadota bacterium]|nr:hypothetical protein [Gemmatimonadota bacterium]